jgi:hypothetical protein
MREGEFKFGGAKGELKVEAKWPGKRECEDGKSNSRKLHITAGNTDSGGPASPQAYEDKFARRNVVSTSRKQQCYFRM